MWSIYGKSLGGRGGRWSGKRRGRSNPSASQKRYNVSVSSDEDPTTFRLARHATIARAYASIVDFAGDMNLNYDEFKDALAKRGHIVLSVYSNVVDQTLNFEVEQFDRIHG